MEEDEFLPDGQGNALARWEELLPGHTNYLPLLRWLSCERWLLVRKVEGLYLSFEVASTGSYNALAQMGHLLIVVVANHSEVLLRLVREAGWEINPAVTSFKLPEGGISKPTYNEPHDTWVITTPLVLITGAEC